MAIHPPPAYGEEVEFLPTNVKIPNRGLRLMTKRTLLNIGMLLRDSEVAKELRRRILDIVHDAENGNGSIETVVNEIDEEKRLSMELGDLKKIV